MGRASKNRGPIGHNRGQVHHLPDSPGERKAPCSLAPWQLPPKVSPAGDVRTRATHQRKHSSPRTAVAVSVRLEEPGESVHGAGRSDQPHYTATVVIRRRDGSRLRQLHPDAE